MGSFNPVIMFNISICSRKPNDLRLIKQKIENKKPKVVWESVFYIISVIRNRFDSTYLTLVIRGKLLNWNWIKFSRKYSIWIFNEGFQEWTWVHWQSYSVLIGILVKLIQACKDVLLLFISWVVMKCIVSDKVSLQLYCSSATVLAIMKFIASGRSRLKSVIFSLDCNERNFLWFMSIGIIRNYRTMSKAN